MRRTGVFPFSPPGALRCSFLGSKSKKALRSCPLNSTPPGGSEGREAWVDENFRIAPIARRDDGLYEIRPPVPIEDPPVGPHQLTTETPDEMLDALVRYAPIPLFSAATVPDSFRDKWQFRWMFTQAIGVAMNEARTRRPTLYDSGLLVLACSLTKQTVEGNLAAWDFGGDFIVPADRMPDG